MGPNIKTCTRQPRKALRKMVGIEPDFLDPLKPREFLFKNPLWEVIGSVTFCEETGAPFVLACPQHKNGSTSRYIHPPRNPNGTLPAKIPDQLTPAVARPRTIKSVLPHHFSHSYHMHQMVGQYNGVDTVQTCTNYDFRTESMIARKSESLSIKGRRDMKNLLNEWCHDTKVLPPEVGQTMLHNANEDFPDDKILNNHCKGATYITFSDAMKLQQLNKTIQGRTVLCKSVDEAGSGHEELILCQYVTPWPPSIIHVHPYNSHGCDYPLMPMMCNDLLDCRLAWYLVAMHACLPALWEASDAVVERENNWMGWLLSFATKTCYPERTQSTGNVASLKFRYSKNIRKDGDLLYQLLVRLGLLQIEKPDPGEEKKSSTAFASSVLEEDSDSKDEGWEEPTHLFEIGNDENSEDKVEMDNDGLVDAEEVDCKVHTDGRYHCEDFASLFSKHGTVKAIHHSYFPAIFSDLEESVDCVVLYQDNSCDGQLRDSIPSITKCHRNHEWDLRFVGSTAINGSKHTRTMFCRHGGSSFPGWWKQKHGSRTVTQEKLPNRIPTDSLRNWDVAIYVKMTKASLEECRDLFLESMGNQSAARCEEHDFPLVVSPFKSTRNCCLLHKDGSTCVAKKVAFQCPVEDCSSALCMEHHKSLPRMQGEHFRVQPNVCNTASTEEPTNDLNIGSSNASVEKEQTDRSIEDQVPMEIDHLDDRSYYSDTEENRNDFAGVTNPIDFGNANDASDEDAGYGPNEFPITTNLERPLQIHGDPRTVSGCTILNNMGSLLVRHNDKLKGSKNQQFFLQHIVSTTPGKSIPLLYPEGMLFPSIFWKGNDKDGLIVGAIPSGLLAHDVTLRKHGIASIQSHVTSRITNTSIPTSSSVPYLCHAFDEMINLRCRQEDVRVVLHRGVTGTKTGVRLNGSDNRIFDTDNVDSRPVVNRLAAAVANREATYFFSHTANMKDHFGLAPIKEWIDSDEAVNRYCSGGETLKERQEIRQALQQEAAVTLLRVWMEVSILYMNYITNSKEQPLGEVDNIWWRFEFQDSIGNLPHIHALIWLKDKPSPDKSEIEERIRGSIMSLIEPDEIDDLVAEGLLSCIGEEIEVQELTIRVLKHVCSSRCKRRIGPGDKDLRCQVPDNAQMSPDRLIHATAKIDVQHTAEAEAVLKDIGLFVIEEGTGNLVLAIKSLVATTHYPPSDPSDGVISPCNGRLFVATRSNQNLKIATGYLASRYLAKYLALVDENNRVYVGAMAKDQNSLKLDTEFLHNTKVTGSAIQEAKRSAARRDRNHPTGRAISHMEMISVILGYDQVYTNLSFFQVPTVPFEERQAVERKRPYLRLKDEGVIPPHSHPKGPEDLEPGNVIPSYKVRNIEKVGKLPIWRRLSDVESLILRDQCLSPLNVDAITIFGIRPPELRFIAQPKLYFRWFYRCPKSKHGANFHKVLTNTRNHIQQNLQKTSWIDGLDCWVYVRPAAVPEILNYLTTGGENGSTRSTKSFYPMDVNVPLDGKGNETELPFRETLELFEYLNRNLENAPRANTPKEETWEIVQRHLIGPAGEGLPSEMPIIWYNSVKPTQPN